MKTVEEHNAEMRKKYKRHTSPVMMGVQCPECDGELIDTNTGITLTSYPPQKNVHCSKCEYIGYLTV